MPEIFNIKKLKTKLKKPAAKPISTKQIPQPSLPAQSEYTDKEINTQPETSQPSQNLLGIFTTFLKNPTGISFAEQDSDETIALFLRRDFGSNTPWIVATIVLIFIPILLSFILNTTHVAIHIFPRHFVLLFTVFYYFVTFGFAFSNFLTWFFTIGMVTSKRAIDIDFANVSSINFATADLADIIDAKYTQNGFSQSFFDFGDVDLVVQTPMEKLVFEKAPKPAEVANIIDDLTNIKVNV